MPKEGGTRLDTASGRSFLHPRSSVLTAVNSPDARWMRRALRLAARARGSTAPNPMVGAVLVRDGAVVGEGYHRVAGGPHAEVLALRQAGDAARGATCYVNLEPCCHFGRTPPCTRALIEAGVARVVAAMADPFPRVAGGGLEELRDAGIMVEVGVLETEARRLNEVYLKYVTQGLPFVTLKMAMTLDGKIATTTGDSRWVTGEEARRAVHRWRSENAAVMVGIGTALADDPLLTARVPRARNPTRVVVDARAELPLNSQIGLTLRAVPTLVAVSVSAPADRCQSLETAGARVLRLPEMAGRVDLRALMSELAHLELSSVLVEGGAELAAGMIDAGLVDRVAFFIAPKLIGGRNAPGPVGGAGLPLMENAIPVHDVTVRRFGSDIALIGYVHWTD
jgi:diaminohydroxyphosphoribosylaminopyrimidine deaminase/5-amino-6-(5-phosphoribosylamino)uracil reductase